MAKENAHTIGELRQLQGMPLHVKEMLTKNRIREWIREYGEDGVYVSFSGGKDSTVLLDIVRSEYPGVRGVFVNTGLEYPETVNFVKSFENIDIIRPKMNFKQVISKYGYPVFSKEVADTLYYARKFFKEKNISRNDVNDEIIKKSNFRVQKLYGAIKSKKHGVEVDDPSPFTMEHYQWMLDANFDVSAKCCGVMKKDPMHKYEKETDRVAFLATMANESRQRRNQWLLFGCNGFDRKVPLSTPMSFWTEQDVLEYIKTHNLPISPVYGNIVPDMPDECEGQMSFFDMGLLPECRKLKTTGADRTGCMFCLFGIHMEKSPNRLERMKETHPKIYEWIMKPVEQGGLGYKEIIDWINENGNMNIKY